jgi:hypothetical protein
MAARARSADSRVTASVRRAEPTAGVLRVRETVSAMPHYTRQAAYGFQSVAAMNRSGLVRSL